MVARELVVVGVMGMMLEWLRLEMRIGMGIGVVHTLPTKGCCMNSRGPVA